MTVFELTIVLLIGLIIVGVGWMMTRPAVTQTKLSRVREDHRALARALSNYQIDYASKPQDLATLRSHDSYLGSTPLDPFQRNRGGYVYVPSLYPDMPALLISAGPDGDFDLPPELLRIADITMASPDMFPPSRGTNGSSAMSDSSGQAAEAGSLSQEAALGIISAYLYLGSFNAERGNDGDVITIVH